MILILTSSFGDGHNTAANSIATALRSAPAQPAVPVAVVDLVAETLPWLAKPMQSAYQTAIIHFPSAWKWVYNQLADPAFGRRTARVNNQLAARLGQLIDQHQPTCLVSTYPLYSSVVNQLRQRSSTVPPLVSVITDSISIHPAWLTPPSDLYLVADEGSRQHLLEKAIPPEKIHVSGFPVNPVFAAPPEPATDAIQRILYLPSTPARHVAATLEALRPLLSPSCHLTIPVGKHGSRLYHTLTRFADSLPPDHLTIMGWTPLIPQLLRSHQVVICKAGGAILHEVLAARIPAVIDYVVPGQEEGNAELLLSHDCALRSHQPDQTAAAVRKILEDNGKLAHQMKARMIPPLSLPDAAFRAADAIRQLLAPPSA